MRDAMSRVLEVRREETNLGKPFRVQGRFSDGEENVNT